MKEPVLFKNLQELFGGFGGASASADHSFPGVEKFVCNAGTKTSHMKVWTLPQDFNAGSDQENAVPFTEKMTIIARENSDLEYIFFQNFPAAQSSGSAGVSAAAKIIIHAKRDAKVKLTVIQNGGSKSHIEVEARCEGENSEIEIRGLQNGNNEQKFALNVHAVHLVPHTRSDVHVRCIARDRSHLIFNGLVTITEGAHHTEAYQKNRNLILSDKAVVDSFPKLFIANDEVKCAHGSSTSTLDPDQALYLQSRGIDGADAEQMLTDGFIRQSLDWITGPDSKEFLEQGLHLAGREDS